MADDDTPDPVLAAVKVYLTSIEMKRWTDDDVLEALEAEIANQQKVCKFPTGPDAPQSPLDYEPDLRNALWRRVARSLALRPLPLGVQSSSSENAVAQIRIGGLDAEVRRLEAPHRKYSLG